jgi:hypothetical protein
VVAWQGSVRDKLALRTRVGVLNRRARDPYALWDIYTAMSAGQVHPFLQVSNVTGPVTRRYKAS